MGIDAQVGPRSRYLKGCQLPGAPLVIQDRLQGFGHRVLAHDAPRRHADDAGGAVLECQAHDVPVGGVIRDSVPYSSSPMLQPLTSEPTASPAARSAAHLDLWRRPERSVMAALPRSCLLYT